MPKEKFEKWRAQRKSIETLNQAIEICDKFDDDGFDLTVRQLFYQLVAGNYIPNEKKAYVRLIEIIKNARRAGLLDWDVIVDRTRNLTAVPLWKDPQEIIKDCVYQFKIDKWKTQPCRLEIWVEKEALSGVVEQAVERYYVPYFSCRGYVSESEMYKAGRRLSGYIEGDQEVKILYLGDHDPSGLDMDRDIANRLALFMNEPLQFKRIALTKDQAEEYNLPANNFDKDDKRLPEYIERFGDNKTWELDALNPATIDDLITTEIEATMDVDLYNKALVVELDYKDQLRAIEI